MNQTATVLIESIDLEGKGVARLDGKTIFIEGALPGEKVEIEIYRQKPSFALARVVNIITSSPDRVMPQCPNFGRCGGCSMQHLEFSAQVVSKQKVLVDNLKHIGNCESENILQPILGTPWNYRHRARMSARFVRKKDSALLGFREKGSSYVADMSECHVLPKHISNLIPHMRELLFSLSIRESIPQIEVAVGDTLSVFVFRIMTELNDADQNKIKQFVDSHNTKEYPLQIWLQPKGVDSCYPFYPLEVPQLSYSLSQFDIIMPYYPTEFTQVNPRINEQMVAHAIGLLDPQDNEIIFDFFCGIGNFTLPIATLAKNIIGFEGSEQLVKRATENALHNKLSHKAHYHVANLFTVDSEWLKQHGVATKWLIDPPRDGAFELIKSITPENAPRKIVYVSCNPATLARDSDLLVNTLNYRLTNAGVINMFPHTSHIESIAVFERCNSPLD